MDITSSFMHVSFGVWCLCWNLALKARLPGKVHQAPHDKTLKPGTSQAIKWAWLQEAQAPTREEGNSEDLKKKCWILWDKHHPIRVETSVKGQHAEGRNF
jgi:hypothetical protein